MTCHYSCKTFISHGKNNFSSPLNISWVKYPRQTSLGKTTKVKNGSQASTLYKSILTRVIIAVEMT